MPNLLEDGGARRDRTDDLMLAKHALYQLSYGPSRSLSMRTGRSIRGFYPKEMVGPGRLELPTLRLSGVRSNQLSYGPMAAPPTTNVALGLAIAPKRQTPLGPGDR